MPPWMTVLPKLRKCAACSRRFKAKRDSAKYCSTKCINKGRGPRPYDAKKSAKWRASRLGNPGYRERINAQAKARAIAIRRWLNSYKLDKGCVDCGFRKHPAALHFDHCASNKTLNVCNAKSITQAKREIAKCTVRCANCHAIKTWPHLLAHK